MPIKGTGRKVASRAGKCCAIPLRARMQNNQPPAPFAEEVAQAHDIKEGSESRVQGDA